MNGESELPRRYCHFGEFELDFIDETLRRDGKKLNINRRMFQVLRLLVERSGEIVTKDEFFEKVWDGSFVEDNNLTVTITALRKILEDNAKQARFIENLPRKGYRFVAPVSINSALAVETFNTAETSADVVSPSSDRNGGRIVFGILATCLLMALLLGGYGGFWGKSLSSANSLNSVAVLPFESQDSEAAYLAEGLTAGVINSLSRLSGVRIIDRNSAYKLRNKSEEAAVVGRELNVKAVLTAQIEQAGDDLNVSVQFTDVAANTQRWSKQFKRPKSEIFYLLAEIEQQVASDIRPETTRSHISTATGSTPDPEAYDLYLKGQYYWNKRDNTDIIRSIDLFRAALDKDPTFAMAYVGLANAYSLGRLGHLGISDDERVTLAKGAIKKALEIDPTIGEAYAASGINKVFYDWDFAGAEADYQRALELNPNDATSHHWYAELLCMLGRFDESYEHYDQALLLDPMSLPIRADLAFAHYSARDFDTAIELFEKIKVLDPEFERAYQLLELAYREKGLFLESIETRRTLNNLQMRHGTLPRATFDNETACADELKRGFVEHGATGYWQNKLVCATPDPILKAVAYSKLGDKENAFSQLEQAFSLSRTGMVWLKVAPDLDGIKSDPRYQELLHHIGF